MFRADDVNSRAARESNDPQINAAALSYFAGRSGDMIMIPKENWLLAPTATTHGTLYQYDQRVPILFYGAAIALARETTRRRLRTSPSRSARPSA